MGNLKGLFFLLLSLMLTESNAQAVSTAEGFWNAIFLQGPINKESPWGYFFESQVRINADESANRGNRILLRPAIRYALNAECSFAVGYGWTPNLSPFKNESRFWEQVTFQKSIENGSLQSRTRIEQRNVEGVNVVAHRFREMIRWTYRKDSSSVGFSLWDELFINLNDSLPSIQSGFDQNRLFLGPALYFSNEDGAKARLEIGYLGLIQKNLFSNIFAANLFFDL